MSGFRRAERRRAALKLAITGPSGSGKTYSALRLAFGLGKRVAVIDTENGSAELYAGLGEYDVCPIEAPFTVEKYVNAIKEAAAGGYDVLIIDSLSHAWSGDGGLLAQKEALDRRGGNQYTNWAPITKAHEAFKAAILHAPLHVIATMRSKTEYVVENGSNGKTAPKKVGLAPVQRDGMEYEFTTVFDVAADHTAIPSKDRTGLFDGLNATLTEEHGRQLAAWLNSGAEPIPEAAPVPQQQSRPAPAAGNGARPAGGSVTAGAADARPAPTSSASSPVSERVTGAMEHQPAFAPESRGDAAAQPKLGLELDAKRQRIKELLLDIDQRGADLREDRRKFAESWADNPALDCVRAETIIASLEKTLAASSDGNPTPGAFR